MTIHEELGLLRKEMRSLRQRIPQLERAWKAQKNKNKKLLDRIIVLEQKNRILTKENKELKDKIDSTTNHKNTLIGMLFKPSTKKTEKSGKKRGGQAGHKACIRKQKPIDEKKHVHLTHCPHCRNKVKRNKRTYTRIVEDILPPPSVVVTEYTIEKQKCAHCNTYVSALPSNTVPYAPYGIHIIIMILTLKYTYRLPIAKIQEYARDYHNLYLSQGAIQNILHGTQKRFRIEYEKIRQKVRGAPMKHADETGWRIEGQNNWCWLFATQKEALYTIEETRGKGVPEKTLTQLPRGVLVRDDYTSYKHLNMPQQSCWTHLLRISREGESKEAKKLHQTLKNMFEELKVITEMPFDEEYRKKHYTKYTKRLQRITATHCRHKDTKKVQTRITNQNTNLITALLYKDVPLTNNHAEQQIRPLTVQRKISGGSRSSKGAQTQAVNMSILQTLKLRGENVTDGVRKLLETPHGKFVVERGE